MSGTYSSHAPGRDGDGSMRVGSLGGSEELAQILLVSSKNWDEHNLFTPPGTKRKAAWEHRRDSSGGSNASATSGRSRSRARKSMALSRSFQASLPSPLVDGDLGHSGGGPHDERMRRGDTSDRRRRMRRRRRRGGGDDIPQEAGHGPASYQGDDEQQQHGQEGVSDDDDDDESPPCFSTFKSIIRGGALTSIVSRTSASGLEVGDARRPSPPQRQLAIQSLSWGVEDLHQQQQEQQGQQGAGRRRHVPWRSGVYGPLAAAAAQAAADPPCSSCGDTNDTALTASKNSWTRLQAEGARGTEGYDSDESAGLSISDCDGDNMPGGGADGAVESGGGGGAAADTLGAGGGGGASSEDEGGGGGESEHAYDDFDLDVDLDFHLGFRTLSLSPAEAYAQTKQDVNPLPAVLLLKRRAVTDGGATDPKLPLRSMTAYNCFAQEERKGVLDSRRDLQDIGDKRQRNDAVSRELGRLWKEMAPTARERYERLATSDRQRYLHEMNTYTPTPGFKREYARIAAPPLGESGGKPSLNGGPKGDPTSSLSRPKSAYNIFTQQERQGVLAWAKGRAKSHMSGVFSQRWASMSAEEKALYLALERCDIRHFNAQAAAAAATEQSGPPKQEVKMREGGEGRR